MSGSFLAGPPREAELGGKGGCLNLPPLTGGASRQGAQQCPVHSLPGRPAKRIKAAKGGWRGIFFDRFELFLRSPSTGSERGNLMETARSPRFARGFGSPRWRGLSRQPHQPRPGRNEFV